MRAELLLLCLRFLKQRQSVTGMALPAVRKKLKYIERIVPHPPAGTQTEVIDAGGVNAVRVTVPQSRTDRYVLFFHGGGYVVGSPTLYRDFTWRIAVAARACVLYFDYRLAPEHPFPAAVDDSVKAYGWLAQYCHHRSIAFVGDSAGGGLALATLHRLRDKGFALPAAVAVVSPWTDLALTGASLHSNAVADPMMNINGLPSLANQYLAGADPRNPYASPLYGDTCGLPPTLIQVGSDEILYDDAFRMAEKLKATGCDIEIEVWPRMPHAWHLYARILPEGHEAIQQLGRFLDRKLSRADEAKPGGQGPLQRDLRSPAARG
jgi:acetyl esterase/lipase